jgi:hypothetical protein
METAKRPIRKTKHDDGSTDEHLSEGSALIGEMIPGEVKLSSV